MLSSSQSLGFSEAAGAGRGTQRQNIVSVTLYLVTDQKQPRVICKQNRFSLVFNKTLLTKHTATL